MLKVRPNTTDMAAASPAVLARRRCEATSPTKAQPSCPTFAVLVPSVGREEERKTGGVQWGTLTSVVPEHPETGDKDEEVVQRLRVADLAEDAHEQQREGAEDGRGEDDEPAAEPVLSTI